MRKKILIISFVLTILVSIWLVRLYQIDKRFKSKQTIAKVIDNGGWFEDEISLYNDGTCFHRKGFFEKSSCRYRLSFADSTLRIGILKSFPHLCKDFDLKFKNGVQYLKPKGDNCPTGTNLILESVRQAKSQGLENENNE